jgi:hypothetical protein
MLSDTTPEARRFYYRRLAEMSPAERMAVGMELAAAGDELVRAAVRRRFPDAEGEEFEYRVLRVRYGRALADQVYRR